MPLNAWPYDATYVETGGHLTGYLKPSGAVSLGRKNEQIGIRRLRVHMISQKLLHS